MRAAHNNPASETLLSVLQPFLNESVIVVSNIEIPGIDSSGASDSRGLDMLLVGEYETVGVTISAKLDNSDNDWSPRYPIGLLTELYTIPAEMLFFHLDDFAYLLAQANPSLFIPGTSQKLSNRASKTVRETASGWISGSFSIAYRASHRVDLDIARKTSIHRLGGEQSVFERAA